VFHEPIPKHNFHKTGDMIECIGWADSSTGQNWYYIPYIRYIHTPAGSATYLRASVAICGLTPLPFAAPLSVIIGRYHPLQPFVFGSFGMAVRVLSKLRVPFI
jgi:hypothetical protein